MKCIGCGATLNEKDKFCGVCGTKVEVQNNSIGNNVNNSSNTSNTNSINNVSINPNPNYSGNINYVSNNNQLDKDENTCLAMGVTGLITSFIFNILSLPFSIIAIVKGAKVKKQTNKTQPGFVMGIIGIVVAVILFLFFLFVAILAIKEVNNEITNSKNNSSLFNEKLKDNREVGNKDVGYIKIPNNWVTFKDPSISDENMIMYSDPSGDKIVTLTVYKNPSFSVEQYRENLKKQFSDNNNYVMDYEQYIGDNIKAQKIGGQLSGKELYTWTFADKKGNIHYIALESTDYDYDVFGLIDEYDFDDESLSY